MAWGRITRCRNGAAACYSTNIWAFNPRHGGSYRSRGLKWEPKKAKINAKDAPAPTTQSKTKKRVSFADPVAFVLGEPPEVASAREKYMRPNSIRAEEIRKELEQNTIAAKNLEGGGYGQQGARTAPDCKSRQIPYSPASLISVN